MADNKDKLDQELDEIAEAEEAAVEDVARAEELEAKVAATVEDAADEAGEAGAAGEAGEDADEAADEDDADADDSEDSLTYSNGVIEKIVAMATREVPHVLGMKGNLMHAIQEQFGAENLTKGVTVEVTDDNRVIVNISVIIEYGAYAPDIFEDVKERVTERLAAMTGLEVAGVNLRIEDVVTPEEFAATQRHLVDGLKAEEE